MNEMVAVTNANLLTVIDRASQVLAEARTAAEILEAKEMAGFVYDAAKKAARLAAAKGAHDGIIADAHRLQADALEMEARAKRRLADEYDSAQARGEISKQGAHVSAGNMSTSDLGISRKEVYEAREIRDAEEAEPGIVRRALDTIVESGEAPTRATVKRAINGKTKRKRHARRDMNDPTETQHDRDLRMLLGMWEAACETAREAFLEIVVQ